MLDSVGSSARRAAAAVCLAVVCASGARAQTPPASPRPAVSFLPRSDFYFSWAALTTPDPRFAWDSRIGIDLDLVDYGLGRVNLSADYEAVLGNERRTFDLNHENYMIEASASYRLRAAEVAVAFHHVSRHLSDRANTSVVAWNNLIFRATRRFAVGGSAVDARLEVGHVLQRNFADYVWTSDLRLAIRHPISRHLGFFAGGDGGLTGVDPNRAGRHHRLCGSRLETGVRVTGQTGALELYLGYERRIDAYPVDRTRQRWFAFGFRLVTK